MLGGTHRKTERKMHITKGIKEKLGGTKRGLESEILGWYLDSFPINITYILPFFWSLFIYLTFLLRTLILSYLTLSSGRCFVFPLLPPLILTLIHSFFPFLAFSFFSYFLIPLTVMHSFVFMFFFQIFSLTFWPLPLLFFVFMRQSFFVKGWRENFCVCE